MSDKCNKCGDDVKGFFGGRCEDCYADDVHFALGSGNSQAGATERGIGSIVEVRQPPPRTDGRRRRMRAEVKSVASLTSTYRPLSPMRADEEEK